MNLKPWVDKGALQKVAITEKSLKDLLRLIDRDLKDCQIREVSGDRRFATAYGAALNLASYAIRRRGYRVSGKIGHHRITFEVAGIILGSKSTFYMDFFDLCRRKRNKVDYDLADVVSESEVEELIEMVKRFQEFVISEAT